jgi:hypothetical protein
VANRLKQLLDTTDDNHKLWVALLTPSWLSGLVVVIASLAVMVITLVTLNFPGSSLQIILNDQKSNVQSGLGTTSSTINNNFSSSELISDIPLFVLWGCVGLLTYSFATSVGNAFRTAHDFRAELHFTNLNRRQLLRHAWRRLSARIVMLAIWFLLIHFTIHIILPYAVALTQFAGGTVGLANTLLNAGMAFVVLTFCLHLHTIMLRLIFLKPRILSTALYLD